MEKLEVKKLEEDTVDRITLSCCGLVVWKRTSRFGDVIKSFGYEVLQTNSRCVGCSKEVKQKKHQEAA